jgi:hypothetical protein
MPPSTAPALSAKSTMLTSLSLRFTSTSLALPVDRNESRFHVNFFSDTQPTELA